MKSPAIVQLLANVNVAPAIVLLITIEPASVLPQVRLVTAEAVLEVKVTVFPVRSNVPFCVKFPSMLNDVPEKVIVPPELLVIIDCVLVQEVAVTLRVPLLTRVPELKENVLPLTFIVPLLVKLD